MRCADGLLPFLDNAFLGLYETVSWFHFRLALLPTTPRLTTTTNKEPTGASKTVCTSSSSLRIDVRAERRCAHTFTFLNSTRVPGKDRSTDDASRSEIRGGNNDKRSPACARTSESISHSAANTQCLPSNAPFRRRTSNTSTPCSTREYKLDCEPVSTFGEVLYK